MNVVHQSNGKYRLDAKTTEDKIAAYFMKQIDKEQLSPKEQKIMKRWVQVYTIKISNFYSDFEAVKIHHTLCEEQGDPIGGTTAFYDLQNAMKVFGNITTASKEAKRSIYEAWQTEVFRMAMKDNDIQGMNRAIKNLIDMHALNKPSVEKPAGDQKPSMFVLAVYSKDAEKPKFINLDEIGQIPKQEHNALMDMIDQEEITDIEMKALLEEADGEEESESD